MEPSRPPGNRFDCFVTMSRLSVAEIVPSGMNVLTSAALFVPDTGPARIGSPKNVPGCSKLFHFRLALRVTKLLRINVEIKGHQL
jgi:hypothetical protein